MEREVTMESMQNQMNGMQTQLVQINATLATHSEQIKGALKRIDEQAQLTATVHKLATSIELLVAKQEITSEKVAETNKKLEAINRDVEDIKQKPARKWEDLVKLVIAAVVGGVGTYILTKFGLK